MDQDEKLIELNSALSRIEREWDNERKTFFEKNGMGSESKEAFSYRILYGAFGLVQALLGFGATFIAMYGAIGIFYLACLAFIVLIAFGVYAMLNQPTEFVAAEARYVRSREALMREIAYVRQNCG